MQPIHQFSNQTLSLYNKDHQKLIDFKTYSVHSHRLRTILNLFLRTLCCLPNSKNASFVTFKAEIGDEIFYIKAKDYDKWRKEAQLHSVKAYNDFSEDFQVMLRSIKNAPTQTVLLTVPAVSSATLPEQSATLPEQVEIPTQQSLIKLFQSHKSENEWKKVLNATSNEVLVETIQLYERENTEKDFYNVWLKKLYPLLNDPQKDLLINSLVSPEKLAFCFPLESQLITKIADRVYNTPDKMKTLFRSLVSSLNGADVNHEDKRPLLRALINKFPENSKQLFELAKKENPLELTINFLYLNKDEMLHLIFEEMTYEMAESYLIGCIHNPRFYPGFIVTVLKQANQVLNTGLQPNGISAEYLKLLLKMFEELQKVEKSQAFLRDFFDYFDPVMINAFIIAALRFKNEHNEDFKLLDYLYKHSLILSYATPSANIPNEILEANLQTQEKLRFLEWAIEKHPFKDARFKNVYLHPTVDH